jgi:hypothetical protein
MILLAVLVVFSLILLISFIVRIWPKKCKLGYHYETSTGQCVFKCDPNEYKVKDNKDYKCEKCDPFMIGNKNQDGCEEP